MNTTNMPLLLTKAIVFEFIRVWHSSCLTSHMDKSKKIAKQKISKTEMMNCRFSTLGTEQ